MKLRRGLGKGKVVSAEELSRRLAVFDEDKDGSLSREDLQKFLRKGRVGGEWFCRVLVKTMWQIAEDRKGDKVDSITADALGKIIHFTMSRPPSPSKRYVLEPDVMQGYRDPELLDPAEAPSTTGLGAKPAGRGQQRGGPRTNPRPRAGGRPGPRPRPGGAPSGRRPSGRRRPAGRRARPSPKPRR